MSADAYFEEEAEVSEGEEFRASSDEEDDEDDDKNLEDLIDDNPVDEEEDDDSSDSDSEDDNDDDDDDDDEEQVVSKKRRRRDFDDRLEDDDYDLIEENLGVKVERKKFRRLKQLSSDEESETEEKEEAVPVDEREQIANELFDGADEEEELTPIAPTTAKEDDKLYGDLDSEGEEESDGDDFIVDDDGQPIRKKKDRRRLRYTDSALQEAQDIFGLDDFDFREFEKYGEDQYEEEEEDMYEMYEEVEEEGETEVKPKAKKTAKKKAAKKSIYEVFEPSELERGHFTDLDNEIRTADIPERFQLRAIPVRPTEEYELDEEAEWIHKHAFVTLPVTQQDMSDPLSSEASQVGGTLHNNKSPETVGKIKEALNFIRNQQFEVPFISFYRKEYVEPELNIYDLWKIYHWDEKWTQLRTRKQNLKRLFEKMQNYQFELIPHDADLSLPENIRPLTESDMEKLDAVQTHEELRDVYMHFLLYYGRDIPKMQNTEREKKKKQKREGGEGVEGGETEQPEDLSGTSREIKQAARKGMYGLCEQAGLDGISKKFGLTPEQFGENLRDNYQRHDTEQYPAEPLELAQEHVCPQFPTPEAVLQGARYMVAMQLAHDPLVRQGVRETYRERAKLSLKPTKKGLKEIDENHYCFAMKYLKHKPVKDLENEQYLKISLCEQEGLFKSSMAIDMDEHPGYQTYFDEIKQLYYRDEFSHLVQEWNKLRIEAIEMALTKILYPQMEKELRGKVLQESKEGIARNISRKMFNWIKIAPYQADQQMDEDDEFLDGPGPVGLKVLGVAYCDDKNTPAFGVIIDGDGEVQDFIRLPNIMLRRNSYRKRERELKEGDMEKLKNFIAKKKPHVVAVGAESRDAINVIEDIKNCVAELESEEQMAPINVELIDNSLAVVYANSKMCESEYREYPTYLRQAVSIARRLQDPMIEFSRLCNSDEDILCLRMHPLQDHVAKEDILYNIYLEFVYRTCEVGMDISKAINHPHTAQLAQFVCGLGPRKGTHLIRQLKSNNMRLENRTQLVTACNMGPKVFINCAGFIKIDTNAMGDSTDSYIEVLDGSRVHPETYEWARKMAVDALEYDEAAEENNPAGALDEILENPDKLKDLDLDAFAEELERQGYGNKGITLYDIRAELNSRYKDLRVPFHSPTSDERFGMLTKETPETFYVGKMIMCRVTGFAHRRPRGDQLDQADPVQISETRLWQCPFCLQDDFPDLSEVWSHFDGNKCPGQAVGVKTRLDNGVTGFIPTKMISDKHVKNPEERVKHGMSLHCRITKIDIEKIQIDLTCKSSDLADKNNEWLPTKDDYYDHEAEYKEKRAEEESKSKKNRSTYVKRVIVHPSFHNINYKETEKMMTNMEQGEVVVRPSSKGQNHLTVTWKVNDGIYQHIDVREEGKENAFSLGQSLWIANEEFEDLDEIIARHVQPMASFVRDVLSHKYYKDTQGGKREVMEKILSEEKKKAPSKIPYFMSLSKDYPGKFMLGYQPRIKQRYEYITVTPDGFRYRQRMQPSLNSLLRWFKEHFRDPIPGATPRNHTPMSSHTENTPSSSRGFNLANVDTSLLQKAISTFPSQVFSAIANMTGQQNPNATPQLVAGGQFGSVSGYRNQPFATPQNPIQTPLLTPSYPIQTPQTNPIQTPQYQPTPRQNWSSAASTSNTVQNVQPVPTQPRPAPRRTPQRVAPASAAPAMDWAKAAAQWAKKRAEEKTEPSPMIESTPAAGDATPLIDEQDK
ncbi:transcription elongation factor SPT6-like isoform X2 [Glandiceps talaboti]